MRQEGPILPVLALWAAGLGAAGQFAKLSVPFDAVRAAWPEAGWALGFLVSVLSLLGIVFGLVAGDLVARLGARKLLLGAMGAGAVLSLAQAGLPGIGTMLVLRLAEGASHLVIVVAAPTLMAQIVPPAWRPAAMTLWSTFFGVAFAAVAWLGLPLVAAQGLGALILAHGVWMAAVGVLLALCLPAGRIAGDAPRGGVLAAHVALYRSARMAPPALGWLCYTLTYVSLLTVLPEVMAADDRRWVAPLLPLAGLAVSLTLGLVLLRHLSGVALVQAGFALGLVAALLLMRVPGAPWLALGLMAVLGLVQGGSFAAVPQLNPDPAAQAAANGAMAQMGNLGNTLGTPLLLLLSQMGGARAVFAGLATCYAAGLILHLWQAARRRNEWGLSP